MLVSISQNEGSDAGGAHMKPVDADPTMQKMTNTTLQRTLEKDWQRSDFFCARLSDRGDF